MQGRARVHCCACCYSSARPSLDEFYDGDVPPNTSSCQPQELLNAASHSCAAKLTFVQHSTGAAAIRGSSAPGPAQHAAGSVPLQSAAAAFEQQRTSLTLTCHSQCGALYTESYARLQHGAPYSPAAVRAAQQEPVANPNVSPAAADSPSSSDGRGSSSGGSSGASGSNSGNSAQLPLPDVQGYKLSHWDLHYYVEDMHIPAALRSQAEYVPFTPTTWLTAAGSPAPAGPAAAVAQQPLPAAAGLAGLWRGTYGMHGVELLQLQLLQTPAGYNMFQQHRLPPEPPTSVEECLPGVLLQSVLQRPGLRLHPGMLDMTAETETDGESESSWETASSGGVLGQGQGFGEQEDREMADEVGNEDAGMIVAGAQDVQDHQEAVAAGSTAGYGGGESADGVGGTTATAAATAAAAAAAATLSAAGFDDAVMHSIGQSSAAAAAGASSSGTQQQQQQQQGDVLPLPQQLLLVATKVTGDRNVPAGQVTFAVDLSTRSIAGAGQLLQIHHRMHSAVEVNGPGTRPLVIKVGFACVQVGWAF